jgi:hypothetical protein
MFRDPWSRTAAIAWAALVVLAAIAFVLGRFGLNVIHLG